MGNGVMPVKMRAKRMMWLAAALAEPLVLFSWHRWLAVAGPAPLVCLQASYGLGFALFALIFLGALARWRVTSHPAFWRMATVLAGAAAAAAEIGLHGFRGRISCRCGLRRWLGCPR